jgi:4-amino-4-deoxy-L-arabinose transferase-like glycosyltransferase
VGLRRELLALAAVTLVVRLVGFGLIDYHLMGDGRTYQLLATNLREHGTLSLDAAEPLRPSALRPPLYPALLAGVQAFTGPTLGGVQVVQLFFSVAAAVLLALAAFKVLGRRAGRLAAWALALDPFEGGYVAAFLTESLSLVLCALLVAAWLLLRGRRRALVVGAAAALAALTRDVFIMVPLAVTGLLCLRAFRGGRRRRVARLREAALVLATAALVIAPWTARNAVSLGKFVPVASGGIEYGLWIGSWEASPEWINFGITNYPDAAFPTPEHRARFEALGGELYDERARALMREMAQLNWRADPVRTAARCLTRARFMWLGTRSELFSYRVAALQERGSLPWKLMKASQWGLNAVVVGLGFVFFAVWSRRLGFRARALRWAGLAPLVVTAAAYLPVHSVESRYSQPVLPLLLMGAGVVVTRAFAEFRARRQRG